MDTYIPIPWENVRGGGIAGAELAANWIVLPHWVLAGSYTFMKEWTGNTDPPVIASLRSNVDVGDGASLDAAWYFNDHSGSGSARVHSTNRIDLGATLRRRKFEISLWGQNLLTDHAVEYKSDFLFLSTVVQRGFYARLATRF